MANTQHSGCCGGNSLRVQVPLSALIKNKSFSPFCDDFEKNNKKRVNRLENLNLEFKNYLEFRV